MPTNLDNTNPRDLLTNFTGSELVLGLVGPAGAELTRVSRFLKNKLVSCGYLVVEIRISKDVIPLFVDTSDIPDEEGYERTSGLMIAGNEARKNADDNSILALGAATRIHRRRKLDGEDRPAPSFRTAYIINSLKRPEEVATLRGIYGNGFYLIATHADYEDRLAHLVGYSDIPEDKAKELIDRDADENHEYGQQVTKTFHLADFFIRIETDADMKLEIERLTRIVFGDPFATPTFDEYAMFFAFSASLRSADMSRQVGAVVAKNNQVLAHGANDCPKFEGGLYWPVKSDAGIVDTPNSRDYTRKKCINGDEERTGFDSNAAEQSSIIGRIVKIGKESGLDEPTLRAVLESDECPIADLTEYGRVVHAEMEALLSCTRAAIGTEGAHLYSTTFPCHNCAKHIVAAGIKRVVYIEPYAKSKALSFHDDSIDLGFDSKTEKVHFVPYVGVGPRRFFDLFSYRHGSGRKLARKDSDGYANHWVRENSELRLQMTPLSYLELEELARDIVAETEIKREIDSENKD